MANKRKLIWIVVPVFKEEANIEPLYTALTPVLEQLKAQYDSALLFTDKHSTDQTFEILRRLSLKDNRLRVLRFSRNFGFQRSIYTGYIHARGDAAVQIDCDLQDPPEMITEFVRKWEEGYQVVYGERSQRQESWTMNVIRKIFYRLIDFLSEDQLPYDAGDFRLVDRRGLGVLKQIGHYPPHPRGPTPTPRFYHLGVPYHHNQPRIKRSHISG